MASFCVECGGVSFSGALCSKCQGYSNIKPKPCPTCSTLLERNSILEHVIRMVLPEGVYNAVGLDVDPSGQSLIEAVKEIKTDNCKLQTMLDESLERIESMSIEEFEQECIKAGYTPKRITR